MSNPNSLHWLIWLLALCWPAPGTILATIFVIAAIQKGWLRSPFNTSKIRSLKSPHE